MKNIPIEKHIKEVSIILRNFNQPDKWQESPWLSSQLVKNYILLGKSQTPYQAIRNIFSDILDVLSQESPNYGDILRGRFWEGQLVTRMVKNGRPQYWEERNFYIYQKKAIARFTSLLLEQEQICQESTLKHNSKYKDILLTNRNPIIITSLLLFISTAMLFVLFRENFYPTSKQYTDETLVTSNINPVPTSTNGKVVFQENFENGLSNKFRHKLGLWLVVQEANGNKVLDINSMDNSIEYPTIEFGESDWKDFILESRIKIIEYKGSPLASIRFRGKYILTFAPYWNSIGLAFDPPWEDITYRTIEIQKNKWYPIRMEVKDTQIYVFLESKLIISQEISNEISGLFGLGTWPEAHIQFDDVVVMVIDN